MRPDQLQGKDFERYAPRAREFAVSYLPFLQRLPIAICPSFLQQIQQLDTSFPAEQESLRRQCDFLLHLPEDRLAALLEPFAQLRVPAQLEAEDWIHAPATFILNLSAYLWSSGQIDRFRMASVALFQGVPDASVHPNRLTLVVFGQTAPPQITPVFQKSCGARGSRSRLFSRSRCPARSSRPFVSTLRNRTNPMRTGT